MPRRLNVRQEAFARAVAAGEGLAAAYVRAGFSPNPGNAYRLGRNEYVRKRIEDIRSEMAASVAESIQETGITIARTLNELVRIGFSDLRQAVDDEGRLLPISEWPDDLAAAVSSVKVVTKTIGKDLDGKPFVEHITEIRLWDKNSALEKIGRFLQIFQEHKETQIAQQQQLLDLMKIIVSPNSALPVNAGKYLRLVPNAPLDPMDDP